MSVLRVACFEKILLVLTLLSSGCTGRQNAGAPDHAPERIISLSPTVTETLFELGAGTAVIGRTKWGDFPPEAQSVYSVGDGLNPNIEVLIQQRPDLVIFYPSPMNDAAVRRLADLGVQTAVLRTDELEDVVRVTRELGRLTGHGDSAAILAGEFERRIDSLEMTRTDLDLSAAVLAWWDPPIVIGRTSFQHEMLEIAGARNIFEDLEKPSGQVSIEVIAERDPDIIVVFGDSKTLSFVSRPEWQVVRAVKERRIIVFEGGEFARPSLRAPRAIARIRAGLERAIDR